MSQQIDKHCVKLDGTPPYGSPLKNFIHSKEILACSATIAYLHLIGSGNNPALSLSAYVGIIGGSAIGRALHNSHLKKHLKHYFGSAHNNLYINKKPDVSTLPTKPSHLLAAYKVRNGYIRATLPYVMGIGAGAALSLSGIGIDITIADAARDKQPTTPDWLRPLLFIGVYAGMAAFYTYQAKHVSTAWRFNQVVKGKWVITDEPPKETKLVPLTEELKDLAEGLLPKPETQPGTAMILEEYTDHFEDIDYSAFTTEAEILSPSMPNS